MTKRKQGKQADNCRQVNKNNEKRKDRVDKQKELKGKEKDKQR